VKVPGKRNLSIRFDWLVYARLLQVAQYHRVNVTRVIRCALSELIFGELPFSWLPNPNRARLGTQYLSRARTIESKVREWRAREQTSRPDDSK